MISKDKRFQKVFIAYGYTIDPRGRNEINIDSFKEYILQAFPKSNDAGILCIDLENKIYTKIRDSNLNSKEFKQAKNNFLTLLDVVKKIRPNVKVGFYGIPYKMRSNSQLNFNSESRIDEIIKKSDIIFPTLYLNYSNDQFGGSMRNRNFLKLNLEYALSLGVRYNKKVIPFSWYMIHPSNNSYGAQIMSSKDWKSYLEQIKKIAYRGKSIDGVVYWEPNKKNFSTYKNKRYNTLYSAKDQSQIFLDNMYNNGN
ncbi:hypothetical protein [Sphingobacterium thalpophilum]|uniref:hypothetical protein n=1 Tax=Sphingobacterium thalpophilum TaxID=259 RepID=UPI003D994AE0